MTTKPKLADTAIAANMEGHKILSEAGSNVAAISNTCTPVDTDENQAADTAPTINSGDLATRPPNVAMVAVLEIKPATKHDKGKPKRAPINLNPTCPNA
jgi:hypothetical protein